MSKSIKVDLLLEIRQKADEFRIHLVELRETAHSLGLQEDWKAILRNIDWTARRADKAYKKALNEDML